jgi:hypothetical protein
MPLTEKVTIRREVTYSKDRKHKFMLFIEWDNKLPKAVVIMIAPSAIGNKVNNDLTTQLVINNLNALGYGGVYIGNLISAIGSKSMRITDKSEPYHKENFDIIGKVAMQDNINAIILAWGSIGENNQLARKLQAELFDIFKDRENIIYMIQDGRGKKGLHPLTPSIRSHWELVPYDNKGFIELDIPDNKESEVKENDN